MISGRAEKPFDKSIYIHDLKEKNLPTIYV